MEDKIFPFATCGLVVVIVEERYVGHMFILYQA